MAEGRDHELSAISEQVKDLRGGYTATCALHDTGIDVVKNCTGGNPGVLVSLEPGIGHVPVDVPAFVPVPTTPESGEGSGSVPSPQPTHRPASKASRNTNPKISTRITRNRRSECVFSIFSPS